MVAMLNRVSELLGQIELSLTEDGVIKNIQDVPRIVEAMEHISTMESKCSFINILLNTKTNSILVEFVTIGGWKLINKWLTDVITYSECDSMFVEEILHVLLKLPVTMDLLKQEKSIPLFIKNLSKNSKFNKEVQRLSSEIVKAWTLVITTEAKLVKKSAQDQAHPHDQKQKEEVKRKKVVSESKEENIDPAKIRKQHAPPSSGPRKTGLEDQQAQKVVPKKRPSAETDKATDLKKPKMEMASVEKQALNESLSKVVNNANQNAVKTKTNNEMQKQVERIIGGDSKTKPSEKPANIKIDVEPKIANVENSKQKSAAALTHSTSFADALFKPAQAVVKPKTKAKVKKQNVENKLKTNVDANHPHKTTETAVFASNNKPVTDGPFTVNSEIEEVEKVPEKQPEISQEIKDEVKKGDEASIADRDAIEPEIPDSESCWDPGVPSALKPILVYHRSKKKTNRVKFKEEDNLVSIEYFEIEEGERTNFRKQEAMFNQDYAKIEMMREKMTMQQIREGYLDPNSFTNHGNWNLHVLEFPDNFDPSLLVRGAASIEREIQNKREIGVLAELHFDRFRIPPSPKEPDPETFEQSEPIIIPLGDLSKVASLPLPISSTASYKDQKSPDTKSPTVTFPEVPTPKQQESLSTSEDIKISKSPQQTVNSRVEFPDTTATAQIKIPTEQPVKTIVSDKDFRALSNHQKPILSTPSPNLQQLKSPMVPSVCQAPPPIPILSKPVETSKPILPQPAFNPLQMRPPYQQAPPNPAFNSRSNLNNYPMRPGPVLNKRENIFPNQQRFAPYMAPNRPNFNNREIPPRGSTRPPGQVNPQFHGHNRNQAPTARAPLDASQVCIHYAQGHCKFGDRCTFIHVPRGPPPDPKLEENPKDIDLRDYFGP